MKSDVRHWMPWATVLCDALLISVAFLVAYWLRYDLQWFRSVDPANNVPYSAYLPMVIPLTVTAVISVVIGIYPNFFLQFAHAVLPAQSILP